MPHTYEKILQAIGEASMCWSETPKGVFLSERAVDIAKRLYLDVIGVAPLDTKEVANLQAHNSESVKLPSETLLLSKCSFFETCPVSGKGHAGCYSEAPCFKR